jgi:hypothetical protein
MENEDEFQSSRFIRKNNLILEPITLSIKDLIGIIKNPEFQKGVFVQDAGSVAKAKEVKFGPIGGSSSAIKRSMESEFKKLADDRNKSLTARQEAWIAKFEKLNKYKDLEGMYDTLSNNNGKFHIITKDAIDAIEKGSDKKSKNLLPEPQIKEKSIVYIPNDASTIGNIRKDLAKILTNAKKKEGVDYKFIEKES